MTTYYCNPLVYNEVIKKLEMEHPIDVFHILKPWSEKVRTNPDLPLYKETGRWIRGQALQDDKFCTWVDDLINPPSWAIFFGLVEKEKEVYIHQTHEIYCLPSWWVKEHRGVIKNTS